MPFERNVFVNCPFDEDYKILLKPLLFTILFLGFKPFISQTKSSGKSRIEQIKSYIKKCKYGVHDISRSKPMKKNELPRFNMPYELGLDVGCQSYGGSPYKSKKILILETERCHYLKVISDIGGQDIASHEDDAEILVKKVRDWLSENHRRIDPPAGFIWKAYNQFNSNLELALKAQGHSHLDIEQMPISEFSKYAQKWITQYKKNN
jgi:hypothetical protein